jgi:crotonobetainyl-CoA:carnitine CoA-transferase CaiB-like acyl-CoA transferase
MTSDTGGQPLSGIRVIDLTQGIPGPFCTKILADFGADVIKVEKPEIGDYTRRMGPFPGDISDPEKSGLFLYLNTNKRGITLDLKSAEGLDAVKSLVTGADILVENFKPGTIDKLGLGYDVLKEINPGLIMTSVSNFGQTGPYRDYIASELVLYAMGGRMGASGLPDRYPLKLGGNHVQYQAGNNAAMATIFAWYGREYQGSGGQQVDVSILETQLGSINGRLTSLLGYQYNGERGKRLGPSRAGYPNGHFPCIDGTISVSGAGQRFAYTAAAIGMPELVEDPRYGIASGTQDMDYKEEFLETIWLPWLSKKTKHQAVKECQEHGLLISANSKIDEVMDDNPQLDARKYFASIDHPVAGNLRYPGSQIYNNNGWWQLKKPSPTLGQHNYEISSELKTSHKNQPKADGNSNKRPLEGVRIIDMAVIFAGPYGTMFLGDMGAEVIRVETLNGLPATSRGQFARPSKESQMRAATSPYPDRDPGERPWNRASNFNAHARNKHGITLDMTKDEARVAFRKLVEISDIFIENNATGSMKRLGISYDVVSKWNPKLIMISATGFGQTGPWNYYRGIGTQFEASVGHATVSGYPDMGTEGAPGSVAADAACGVTIGLVATMALRQREKTGKGLYIDISLGENFLPHLGELYMDYSMNGRVAGPIGNRDHLGNLVQGVYQCAGEDEWVAITISNIDEWITLSDLMKNKSKYENITDLLLDHDEVDKIIAKWTADKNPVDLFHELQAKGIMCGHIMHEEHVFSDPHIKDRDFFVQITHPEAGTHLYPSTTYKMSKVPFEVRKPPMRLGEDNDYVFREVIKLSEEEYQYLKEQGHIGMDYAPHVR